MIATRDVRRGASALFPLLLLLMAAPVPPASAMTDRKLQSLVAPLPEVSGTGDITFVVAGDNRPTTKGAPLPRVLKTIFDEIALVRPDFVLWSGDTVYGRCDSQAELEGEYKVFLDLASRGSVPLFNAPGNHEIHGSPKDLKSCPPLPPGATPCNPPCPEELFEKRFGHLYGSFDYAGAHFISLDTEIPGQEDTLGVDQVAWLRKDLESNRKARAIFIFSHTAFYSSKNIDPDKKHAPLANADALHEIFRQYPVKAVFSGHEHLFWREDRDGIVYFVSGGAGAPLYAPPEKGGFSHYGIVRLTGDQVSYDVIEPGHLYVEPAAGTASEVRFWIVNSNDLAPGSAPLTLRGVEVEVPVSLGGCGELVASTESKKVNLSITCTPGTLVHKLRLTAEGMPAGTSMPVVVRHKG